MLGSFDQIVSFLICAAMGFVALAAAALFVIRRRAPDVEAFRVPGYPWTPGAFVALVVCVLALLAVNRPVEALGGLAIVGLGWPAYDLFASARRRVAGTL
jgi:APA family basic amino acid/polyamine antiporter